MSPDLFGQANIRVQRNAHIIATNLHVRYIEKRRALVPGSNQLDFDVHANNINRADTARVGRACAQQVAGLRSLHLPTAVIELPQFDAGVPDSHSIDDQCAIPEQPQQRDTDTDLFRDKQTRLITGTNQLRTVEFQFRATKPPASIHPCELNLHADRGTGPTLDLFLVFGEAWQEQPEQANGYCEHYHQRCGRVSDNFQQALQE